MSADIERSDRFVTWDAAFLLGALSSPERHEYEQHLAGCRACQRSLAELAGLPGLLAQVSRADAALLAGEPAGVEWIGEPPATLRAGLADELARRRRRRLAVAVAGVAAALVLLVGAVGALVAAGVIPFGTARAHRVAFSAVAPSSITAVADIIPREDGTTIAVECQYGEGDETDHSAAYAHYSIWVRDRSGTYTMVKDWGAKPNKVMHPTGESALRIWQLTELQIRHTGTNQVLLTAPLR